METYSAEINEAKVAGASGTRERVLSYVELTKPRIALMLVLTSAAGFYLGSPGEFNTALFVHAMLGIALLAFGVATLNQYIERTTDALMERTANRPLPASRLTAVEALVFGTLLSVGAEIYLLVFVNALTAFLGLIVIVGYVLLYTPLKTRTSASTAIGAVPGAMPPLMGWTAAADTINLGAWALFALLFLWQFPHFLAIASMYKEQYAAAGIKMLPTLESDGRITARQIVMFTILMVPVSLAPFFLGVAGVYYLGGAVLLGIWFLWESIQTARYKTTARSRRLLLVSVLYLPIVFALMVFNH